MEYMPRRMLGDNHIPLSQRDGMNRLLAQPAGWPRDPRLADRARELGFQPPATQPDAPRDRRVNLLSVSRPEADSRGALWSLPVGHGHGGGNAIFVGHADETWQVARRVLLGGLSHFIPAPGVLQPQRPAQPCFLWGAGNDMLDGPSFGMAFLAAQVAGLIDTFVPATDLVATATLESSDKKTWRLGRVDGLRAKIAIVLEAGLGIRRLLVARAQADEAKSTIEAYERQHGPVDLEVVSAETPDEALVYFLGARLDQLLEESWRNDARARDAALRQVWNHTAHNPQKITHWQPVAATASLLLPHLTDAREQRKAEIATQIAKRHTGASDIRISWDEHLAELLGTLHRWPRAELVAHIVQSVNDSGVPNWREEAARARALLPDESDFGPGELKILGALGRLHAAWCDDSEALSLLLRAAEGWMNSPQPAEASYAISALLGHASVMRGEIDDTTARSIEALYLSFTEVSDLPPKSLAFALVAAARFFESRGRIDEAASILSRTATLPEDARGAIHASRERIRARLDAALQRDGRPYQFRGDIVQEQLAALDAALARGTDVGPALAILREHPHSKPYLARIAQCSDAESLARAVQRRYPY
jgi:hypothetical protein